jgi:hypothetical protein
VEKQSWVGREREDEDTEKDESMAALHRFPFLFDENTAANQ